MNTDSRIYKDLYKGGYLVYSAMLILALVFYRERTVFVDIAYHLLQILRADSFAIQNNRYGAMVTQVFPLLAGKLSLPLNWVMMIYSAAFVIYYSFCYYLCGSVLKNYKLALVLLLGQLVLATDTFYWIQSELQQGLAFMMVVFAWLQKQDNQKPGALSLIVIAAFITFLNFFHPLLIAPVAYGFAFLVLRTPNRRHQWLLIAASAFFVIVYYAKSKLLVTAYEEQAGKGIDNFGLLFPHYFGIASNRRFLALCLEKFYWVPVLSALIGLVYLFQKKWLHLLLFTSSMVTFLLLINVSYPHSNEQDFYMENFYLPLGFMIAFPLVYDVLPLVKKRNIAVLLGAVILLTGVSRIYIKHHTYTTRLNWEKKFLAENIDRKLLVYNREVPMDTLLMTWGTPYEFWLLSTTEYGRTASIVIDEHVEKLLWCKWENMDFLTIMEKIHYSSFPSRYFNFTDTVTHYDVTGR